MEAVLKECFSTDILICGAGAAGLTLAIDLARRGVSFRLIDKMPEPFPGSRGKALQPRTLEVLQDLDILDKVAARGGPYPPQREYREDGESTQSRVMDHADPTPAIPYPITLMAPQFMTEGVMRDRLVELGHSPEFGQDLIGFEQDDEGVTARIVGGGGEETVRVRYLVGTDGGRSFVRHTLGVGFPGKTLGIRAVVADVELTGLERDAWHRFGIGQMDRSMSLCPLVGTDMFQLQAPVPLEDDVDLSAEALTAMVTARTHRKDIHIHAVSWASAFNLNARLADNYRVGRVFLAGDAAHIHPPTGGQGLNTSIQDAYNLGWKLAAVVAGAPDTLLDTYEEERRPIAAGMLGLSTKLLDAIKRGDLKRGREVQELDLCYPESPLALETPAHERGVRAGDRAPDAPMRSADGQTTRLFDLFKGPHWTLIGYHVERDVVASRAGLNVHIVGQKGDLVDEGGHFSEAYALTPGDWLLVRPDGYIGAIVAFSEVAALRGYLQRVGLSSENLPAEILA